MQNRCKTEIIELHQFFVDWYTGLRPDTAEAFSRFERVLDDNFTIISPDGSLLERAPLLAGLRQAHNTRPAFRIWIENVRLHYHEGDLALATYEEWQETGPKTTARLSTVLFRAQAGTPNNLVWLHVHETWLNRGL